MPNDVNDKGHARLSRMEGGYCWRGWTVTHHQADGRDYPGRERKTDYNVAHSAQQVWTYRATLTEVRELLPQVDAAVQDGEVPERFYVTADRARKEAILKHIQELARPLEQRRAECNWRLRRYLCRAVVDAEDVRRQFVDTVHRFPIYALEGGAKVAATETAATLAWELLGVPDERLPWACSEQHDRLVRKLCGVHHGSVSTSLFHNAVDAAKLDGIRKLVDVLFRALGDYQYYDVPVDDPEDAA